MGIGSSGKGVYWAMCDDKKKGAREEGQTNGRAGAGGVSGVDLRHASSPRLW